MQTLFVMLGLTHLGTSQMLTIAFLAWASAFGLAWIADAILGDGAFGVVLNTSILIVGAILGMLLWNKLGFGLRWGQPQILTLVATGSGVVLLVTGSVLRRWI